MRNIVQRVGARTVHTQFQVQVVAGGVAGGANMADDIPLRNVLAHTDRRGAVHVGVQGSIGVALVIGAVVNHDIVAIAVVPAGHGDNAACHSADVGAAGRGKVNALVAAAAILAGDILIARQRADKVQRAADGRIGVVPLGLGNQRFQVSVIFISSLIELCLFITLGFFQSLLLRCGGGDAGILGLNVAGQLLGFAVQLAFLVLQLFFVRFQRCLRFFQLGALVGQLNALLFQILAGLCFCKYAILALLAL